MKLSQDKVVCLTTKNWEKATNSLLIAVYCLQVSFGTLQI